MASRQLRRLHALSAAAAAASAAPPHPTGTPDPPQQDDREGPAQQQQPPPPRPQHQQAETDGGRGASSGDGGSGGEGSPDSESDSADFDEQLRDAAAAAGEAAHRQRSQHRRRPDPPADPLDAAFVVSPAGLDSYRELRRMFGPQALPKPHPRMRRSLLAAPEEDWPPLTVGGVAFERGADGELRLVEDGEYRRISEQLSQAQNSHDLQTIQMLAMMHPYHMRLQLQMAYINAAQGYENEGAACITRAAHMFAIVSRGSVDLLGASSRLPCSTPGNRVCFEVLEQLANNHMRRGCSTAALEVTKLIWKLDRGDARHVLLHLDYVAARAGQAAWLAQAAQALLGQYELPSLRYGLAWALAEQGDVPGAAGALRQAIQQWPEALPDLRRCCGGGGADWQRVSDAVAELPAPCPAAAACLRCFAERGAQIWRPKHAGLLCRAAADCVCCEGFAEQAEERRRRRDAALSGPLLRHYATADPARLAGRVERLDEALAAGGAHGGAAAPMGGRGLRAALDAAPAAARDEFAALMAAGDYSMLGQIAPPFLFLLTLLPWNSLQELILRRVEARWRTAHPEEAAEHDAARARRGPAR
eukprot:TRINITY_DN36380_c0_g3_i1.p1 TRINITY_DN36380_c0_g3~~TRINITY_DN36380_c0_g3_i1.p1  ORF type:complete len:618 (+),score=194.02 TRINITY_DN36380_c0_g3_i1:89-1855(+)